MAAEILADRHGSVAVAAEDRVGCALTLPPPGRRVPGEFCVAVYAGVEGIAAFESNGDNITFGVVVDTMRLPIDSRASDNHLKRLIGRLRDASHSTLNAVARLVASSVGRAVADGDGRWSRTPVSMLAPLRQRAKKCRVRRVIEQSNELHAVSIGISEIKLSRWHPTDDGWLISALPIEIFTNDSTSPEPFAGNQQLLQAHGKGKVRPVEIGAVSATRSPQSNH